MKRLMNGLNGTFATIGAAIQVAAAVEAHRKPSGAALRKLAIAEAAFNDIRN